MARKTRKTRRRVKRVKGTRRIRRIRRIKTYYKGKNRRQNIKGGGFFDRVAERARYAFGSVKEQTQGAVEQAQSALESVKEQTQGLGEQAQAQTLGPGSPPQGTTNSNA